MRIVFFGTANVALPILEKLNKQHQVLAVVTNPDAPVGRSKQPQESPVSALARDLNIKTLKPGKAGGQNFIVDLKNLNAEVFVVVAYGTILPAEVINLPPLKTVNVHFSVLPKYRGSSPIQFALFNGDEQTGTSIFILDEQVDHGPLLAQKIVNIEPDDNYFTLSNRLAKISADLFLETLADYEAGKITPLPQDEAAATHTKIITKQDGKVNWSQSAGKIYNQFRAFYPWPGIWTKWNGKMLKITDCIPSSSPPSLPHQGGGIKQGFPPLDGEGQGGVVFAGGMVACGENTFLQIKSLQLEGKNETPIADFLNGYGNFVGSILH